jgi:CheY-like chemotaxis protein
MGVKMDKKKILIIDDERDALFILEKELAGRGYSVIAADNGRDAMNLAKSEHPDLITLDLLMPDIDGMEVAARLKEDPETNDIPVIFLTCLIRKREEEEKGCVVAGRVFIAKPYSIEGLIAQIEKLSTGHPPKIQSLHSSIPSGRMAK